MKSCLLCGVGGQGTVLASRIIASAAMEKGLFARTADGLDRARVFLTEHEVDESEASAVLAAIREVSFSKNAGQAPTTREAACVRDADRLDAIGAIGVARTLQYNGALGEPIWTTTPAGGILDGSDPAEPDSFFREYRYKLEGIYDRFLTRSGAQLAKERRAAAQAFYASLLGEMRRTMDAGNALLDGNLE